MSGMRKYIYLNKKPKPPQTYRDIACKILNFCVGLLVAATFIILAIIGLLLLCLN